MGIEIGQILGRKGLNPALFQHADNLPKLQDNISVHVKWVFEHIYAIPYPYHSAREHPEVPRYIHGIQHVGRVAYYVPVFANLFRKHGDNEALNLTQEDIHLLQIAALFHDAARENEGEDLWDHESAIMLYYYLTKILRVNKTKAKLIAESMANKDKLEKGYFALNEDDKGGVTFEWGSHPPQKNIYQKIIHDADCLDIHRARPHFEAPYLDFYQDIASHNELAFYEEDCLINEARALIEVEGDAYNRTQYEIKKKYNNESAYAHISKDIAENNYRVLKALGHTLLPKASLEELKLRWDSSRIFSEQILEIALQEGKIFTRGVSAPSSVWSSDPTKIRCEQEIRLTLREEGIPDLDNPTQLSEVTGNAHRSISDHGTFANAGLLLISPPENIYQINFTDVGTGHGEKSQFTNFLPLNAANREKKLTELHRKTKMGGASYGQKYAFPHTEIVCDIDKYDAIFFSPDPNIFNIDVNETPEPTHRYSPLLQAIYIQNVHKKYYERAAQYKKTFYIKKYGEAAEEKFHEKHGESATLPLIEYSFFQYKIREVPQSELTEERIISMWVEMCGDYIQKTLSGDVAYEIYDLSVDALKVQSMYGHLKRPRPDLNLEKYLPGDANYAPTLQMKISEAIEKKREALILCRENEILEGIRQNENSDIFDERLFFILVKSKRLHGMLKDKIIHFINKKIEENLLSQAWGIESDNLDARYSGIEFFSLPWKPVQLSFYKKCKPLRQFLMLFMLAQQIANEEILTKIREQAFEKINQVLDKNLSHTIDNLVELIAFYHLFAKEGQREDVTKKLKEVFCRSFETLLANASSMNDVVFGGEKYMRMATYLNISLKHYTASIISCLERLSFSSSIPMFLYRSKGISTLFESIGLSLADQKVFLLKCLKQANNSITSKDIKFFGDFPYTLLQDPEVFEKILDSIKFKAIPPDTNFVFGEYNYNFKELAKCMPNQVFTAPQLKCLEKKIDSYGDIIIAKSKACNLQHWGLAVSPLADMECYVDCILKNFPIAPSAKLLQKFSLRLAEISRELRNASIVNESAIKATESLDKSVSQIMRKLITTPLPAAVDVINLPSMAPGSRQSMPM